MVTTAWTHRGLLVTAWLIETAVGVEVHMTRRHQNASRENIGVDDAERRRSGLADCN